MCFKFENFKTLDRYAAKHRFLYTQVVLSDGFDTFYLRIQTYIHYVSKLSSLMFYVENLKKWTTYKYFFIRCSTVWDTGQHGKGDKKVNKN